MFLFEWAIDLQVMNTSVLVRRLTFSGFHRQGENCSNIREKFSVTFWERKHIRYCSFRGILIHWMHAPTHEKWCTITLRNWKQLSEGLNFMIKGMWKTLKETRLDLLRPKTGLNHPLMTTVKSEGGVGLEFWESQDVLPFFLHHLSLWFSRGMGIVFSDNIHTLHETFLENSE